MGQSTIWRPQFCSGLQSQLRQTQTSIPSSGVAATILADLTHPVCGSSRKITWSCKKMTPSACARLPISLWKMQRCHWLAPIFHLLRAPAQGWILDGEELRLTVVSETSLNKNIFPRQTSGCFQADMGNRRWSFCIFWQLEMFFGFGFVKFISWETILNQTWKIHAQAE